jgi:hypothetical protein
MAVEEEIRRCNRFEKPVAPATRNQRVALSGIFFKLSE